MASAAPTGTRAVFPLAYVGQVVIYARQMLSIDLSANDSAGPLTLRLFADIAQVPATEPWGLFGDARELLAAEVIGVLLEDSCSALFIW